MSDTLTNVRDLNLGDKVKHNEEYHMIRKVLVETEKSLVWVAYDSKETDKFPINETVWVKSK